MGLLFAKAAKVGFMPCAAFAIFLISCSAPKPQYSVQPEISAIYKLGTIPFTDIAHGFNSQCEAAENIVIDSQAKYDSVATQCNAPLPGSSNPGDTMAPDFSVKECAAVFAGAFGSPGDPLDIIAIEQGKGSIIVHSVVWTTPPNVLVDAVAGSPWDIVAFNKVSMPVTFAPVVVTDGVSVWSLAGPQ